MLRLYERFRSLDMDERGFVTNANVLKLPEFSMNPLRDRLIAVIDAPEGMINFRLFCRSLAVFHEKCPAEKKLEFLFKVYDVDRDGRVSRDDVMQVLLAATGDNLSAETREELIKSAMPGKQSVSFEEFVKLFPNMDAVQKKLSFSFSPNDAEEQPKPDTQNA